MRRQPGCQIWVVHGLLHDDDPAWTTKRGCSNSPDTTACCVLVALQCTELTGILVNAMLGCKTAGHDDDDEFRRLVGLHGPSLHTQRVRRVSAQIGSRIWSLDQ